MHSLCSTTELPYKTSKPAIYDSYPCKKTQYGSWTHPWQNHHRWKLHQLCSSYSASPCSWLNALWSWEPKNKTQGVAPKGSKLSGVIGWHSSSVIPLLEERSSWIHSNSEHILPVSQIWFFSPQARLIARFSHQIFQMGSLGEQRLPMTECGVLIQ